MTLTVDDAIHTATETWRRLGVEEATADEMAEELAADLAAASADGRSVADSMGGDVEALATSWADERGLVPARQHLKETAVAAAQGAVLPALAALAFWYVNWSHLLDPSGESMTTTLDGHVVWEIRQFPNAGAPLMWVGLPLCVVAAFFLIRRAVRETLRHRRSRRRLGPKPHLPAGDPRQLNLGAQDRIPEIAGAIPVLCAVPALVFYRPFPHWP